jgi:hypothetical protein
MKRTAIRFTPSALLLLLLLTAGPAAAQERPLPPAHMVLPSDTLSAREAPAKIEADSSRIELPEVVILGQDRSVRLAGSKQRSGDDQPRLIKPEYQSLSLFARRDNSRPLANDAAAARERLLWAGAGAGSFASLKADGGFSGKFPWGSARLSGWLDRSKGAFDNSQHSDGGLLAAATTPLQPLLQGGAQAEMNWLTRGLHGAVPPEMTRSARWSALQGQADWAIDANSSARAGLQLGGAGVTSDTSGREWRHTGTLIVGLHGDYLWQRESVTLRASAAYSRESLSQDGDSLDQVAGFGQLNAEVQTALLRPLLLTAGVGYQELAGGRFAPSLRLAFLPNDRWGLSLAAWAGLRYQSFRERLRENPCLDHALHLAADDSPLSVQLRTDFRPTGTMVFQLAVYHALFDRLHYWERMEETGLIGLHQAGDVRLTEFQFSGRFGLAGGMMLQGELQLNSDHLEHATPLGASDRIPYRPDYTARASLAMPLPWQVQLQARIEMIGERRRGLDKEGRLPGYLLLNAGADRAFGHHVTAGVQVENLLDRAYVVWEGYDEPGIRLMANLKWVL